MKKILIANRGEIARRIIRTAHTMDIQTVAVYSSFDAHLPYVKEASQAAPLDGTTVQETYLNIKKIIAIAKSTGADAIHPGYGFLSENPEFAEMLSKEKIIFIGPSAASMRAVGSKIEAKLLAQSINVPTVPGISKNVSESDIKDFAKQHGFPLLLKASGGGGGRGMRMITSEKEINDQLQRARDEARKFFGSDEIFVEKFIENPKHIEVQCLGDTHGNVRVIGLRDCSLQRNNQKIIEEAPPYSLSEQTRALLSEYARLLLKKVTYESAATVEFLVKGTDIFFLEVNSRLQVEHPVTEAITGLDLVEEQIKIAQGGQISETPPSQSGHAIELRICAEDEDFIASTGRILSFSVPSGMRFDAGYSENSFVTSEYDSLIAKIIIHDDSRSKALAQAQDVLNKTSLFGIKTNIPFLCKLLSQPSFIDDTHHIKTVSSLGDQKEGKVLRKERAIGAFILLQGMFSQKMKNSHPHSFAARRTFSIDGEDPITVSVHVNGENVLLNGFRYHFKCINKYTLSLNDEIVQIKPLSEQRTLCLISGYHFEISTPTYSNETATDDNIISPLPGKIISLSVIEGDRVKKGDQLLSIESMKMEHPLRAPHDGTVHNLSVKVGDAVQNKATLCKILPH